jgi:hypothetical protein
MAGAAGGGATGGGATGGGFAGGGGVDGGAGGDGGAAGGGEAGGGAGGGGDEGCAGWPGRRRGGAGDAGEGELFAARGAVVTDASCRDADAPFAPPLVSTADAVPVVLCVFAVRSGCARLVVTTRGVGGKANQDGS